jgi:hypothetical protein
VVAELDAIVVAAGGSRADGSSAEAFVAAELGVDEAHLRATLDGLGLGGAALVRREPGARIEPFEIGPRGSLHVRHWHKYAYNDLPVAMRFHFRDAARATGVVAPNLSEFHRALEGASEDVLRHHAAHQDFSRWVRDVVCDSKLAAILGDLETQLTAAASGEDVEAIRRALLDAIEGRYLE